VGEAMTVSEVIMARRVLFGGVRTSSAFCARGTSLGSVKKMGGMVAR